jgi:DNA-binding IclR family transcriptional regulator
LGREPLYPAASSGLGQVLLAEWPEEQVRELYTDEHRLRIDPSQKPVALDGLLKQLAEVREQGYALTQTRESSDVRTLGVALKRDNAAIGVAGRFADRNVPRIYEQVAEAARQIENAAQR